MARKSKKKGKAASEAARMLKGTQTTPERPLGKPSPTIETQMPKSAANTPPKPTKPKFWDRQLGRTKFTYRSVGLFLLACILLDVLLFLAFELGFGQCYGILCLI